MDGIFRMPNLQKETFKLYWNFAKQERMAMFGTWLFATLGTLINMGYTVVLKFWVDSLTQGMDPNDFLKWVMVFTIMGLSEGLSWFLFDTCLTRFESKMMKRLSNYCFEIIHQKSYRFFTNRFTGSLVKQATRFVSGFSEIYDIAVINFYRNSLQVLVAIVTFFWIGPAMGAVMLIWTLVFIGAQAKIAGYKAQKYDLPRAAADSKIGAALADTVSNHLLIQSFAKAKDEAKRFLKVSEDWAQKLFWSWSFMSRVRFLQGLSMTISEAIVLVLAYFQFKNGQLSIGEFVLIEAYLNKLFMELWETGNNLRTFYEALANAEEMTEVILEKNEIQDAPDARPFKLKQAAIEFKNVSFGYEDSDDKEVIQKLSFQVKPGETVALIGPSGGGKSTLIKLLIRLFEITNGAIEIDGQDIRHVTQESLRSHIALVAQDPMLFHRSIFENIAYARPHATRNEVEQAAKLARAHDFIQSFPKGYQTLVGERGVKLSGGERQRIAIARAFLSNRPILLLDEATSQLDSDSEHQIQKALHTLMKNRTTLVIAHRLSTVMNADHILVINKGKIVEEGHHRELIKKDSGLYQKLWNLQSKGYLE